MRYQIKPGDTLSAIAARYNTSVDAIMTANPQITNRDKIYAGNELSIPVLGGVWRRIGEAIFGGRK